MRLFDEMRRVKKVGVWPVGVVGGLLAEHALIDGQGEYGRVGEGYGRLLMARRTVEWATVVD